MPTDRLSGFNMGVSMKVACAVATTGANITLSGAQTIDGIAVGTAQERVLVRNQTSSVNNGVYVADSSTWVRARDCDGNKDLLPGSLVYVDRGNTYNRSFWVFNSSSTATSIAVGTDAITLNNTNVSVTGVSSWVENNIFPVTSASSARSELGTFLRNVKDFGAVGDGVTNDTAAITSAIADMPSAGGHLWFPEGTYYVSSGINLNKPGTYFGHYGASRIASHSSTANVFTISAQGVRVRDLNFSSTMAPSTGAFIKIDAADARVESFSMTGFYRGIHISTAAVAIVTIDNGYMTEGISATGVGILVEGGVDLTVRDVLVNNSTACLAGIKFTNSGDCTVEDCQFLTCYYGMEIAPSSGKVVASIWSNNTFYDTCGTHGIYIHPDGPGAIVARCIFDQSWAASAGSHGINVSASSGGLVTGLDFNVCHVLLNAGNGINLGSSSISDVQFNGGRIGQNGVSGFVCSSGADAVTVTGACVGQGAGVLGNGAYGIVVESSATNVTIANNTCIGNSSAMAINTASTNIRVVDNIGFRTRNIGTVSFAASATSVSHGLAYTPLTHEIQLSPLTGWAGYYYVSSAGATTFTVTLSSAQSSIGFAWKAAVLGA